MMRITSNRPLAIVQGDYATVASATLGVDSVVQMARKACGDGYLGAAEREQTARAFESLDVHEQFRAAVEIARFIKPGTVDSVRRAIGQLFSAIDVTPDEVTMFARKACGDGTLERAERVAVISLFRNLGYYAREDVMDRVERFNRPGTLPHVQDAINDMLDWMRSA